MEKITIKPTFREIVLRGKPEEGHVDVFSYNYEENANGLGCLFIVGQVLPASDDTSYMINLISSLAKREYYANVDVIPKDAFSKTLKKINEVLQDFFRNKDLKINIGIFAISGENIFISHLGKFKILLIRENQNIDILNNINLFNKEHIQEKEFSNIISGKVMLKDKIFAFYPTRSFTTREKYIKQYLTKLSIAEFAEKMIEIKQANNNFSCASVHIEIDKHIEPIIIKNPQLQELQELNSLLPRSDIKPQAVLTKISNASKTKSSSAPIKELPNIRPIDNNQSSKNLSTTTNIDNQTLPDDIELKGENNGWKNNVSYPGTPNASALENNPPKSNQENNMESSTLIRPSEFSSAKKDNILDIILKKFKPSGVYIIGVGQSQSVFKNKLILSGALIAGIAVLLVIAKYTFAPTLPVPGLQNSEDKAITALLGQLNERLDSAKSYRDANNLFEARRLLYESLAMLDSSSFPDSEKIISVGQEALIILDQIDKATQVPTNYIDQISQEFGKSHLISAIKDKIIVYTANSNETKSGIVTQSVADGVKSTTKINDFNPIYLFGDDKLLVMISDLAMEIGTIIPKTDTLKKMALSLPSLALDIYPYQGNLYILTPDSIYKIADAIEGKNTAAVWLDKDNQLPSDPMLLAIDSNIFVMSKTGILTTFYRGKKTAEVNTSIPISQDSILLTTEDSSFLYLVDKKMGRIHMVAKETGAIFKTLKLNNQEPITDATIDENESIFILTADNKIWKIAP